MSALYHCNQLLYIFSFWSVACVFSSFPAVLGHPSLFTACINSRSYFGKDTYSPGKTPSFLFRLCSLTWYSCYVCKRMLNGRLGSLLYITQFGVLKLVASLRWKILWHVIRLSHFLIICPTVILSINMYIYWSGYSTKSSSMVDCQVWKFPTMFEFLAMWELKFS